jgi:hypothetical protein
MQSSPSKRAMPCGIRSPAVKLFCASTLLRGTRYFASCETLDAAAWPAAGHRATLNALPSEGRRIQTAIAQAARATRLGRGQRAGGIEDGGVAVSL